MTFLSAKHNIASIIPKNDGGIIDFLVGSRLKTADLKLLRTPFYSSLAKLKQGQKVFYIGNASKISIVSYFNIWSLGLVLVPVEANATLTKQQSYLDSLKPDIVIIEESVKQFIDLYEFYCDTLGGEFVVIASGECVQGNVESVPVKKDDEALVIFTSGSTGKPKGVSLSHQNLYAGAENIISHNRLSPSEHGLCLLPITHINGIVTTIISPVLSKGSVTFYNQEFNPLHCAELVEHQKITWVSGVPINYNQLAKLEDKEIKRFNSVKFFRSASAPLHKSTIVLFEQRFDRALIETMGMSEAAGQIFANPLPPDARKVASVGKAVGFKTKVVDENGNQITGKDVGEIVYQGPGVFNGYYIEREFIARNDDWFASGDLGYQDEEGYVFIRGRKKDIAIISGENISLRALEVAILNTGVVDEVACFPEKDVNIGERINVYLAEGSYQAADTYEQIKLAFTNLLGSSLALGCVKVVAEIPRSAAGKVLKGFLPEQNAVAVLKADADQDWLEAIATILSLAPEALTDDAAMGLTPSWDSLAQVQIVSALEEHLNRPLTEMEFGYATSLNNIKHIINQRIEDVVIETQKQQKVIDSYIAELVALGFGDYDVNYLILSAKRLAEKGIVDVNALVISLINACPDKAIVMNSFCWSYCREGKYDYLWTPAETGLLNEAFRRHAKVIRTSHPIYSYLTYNLNISEHNYFESPDSWGRDSFLAFLCEHESVNVICDGVNFLKGNPAMHYVEQEFDVPYRFNKQFAGQVRFIGQEVYQSYQASMFVRRIDSDEFVNDWQNVAEQMFAKRLFKGDTQAPAFYAYQLADLVAVARELLSDSVYKLAKRKV